MASVYLTLAWRNIWRNRRRTWITIGAIMFALVIVAVMRSLQYGTYEASKSYSVRLYQGDIQVHRKGYQEEQTLDYSLQADEQDWQAMVDTILGLEAFTRRLVGFGLLSSETASTGGLIVGIEPKREREVSRFLERIYEGKTLIEGTEGEALMGFRLAENIEMTVGDTLAVLTQGLRGELGAELYRVRGLIQTWDPRIDRTMVVLTLSDAQWLFSAPDRVTHVVFRGDHFDQAQRYARILRAGLDPDRYEVLAWQDLMPELLQLITLDNVTDSLYLLFLLIIVGFEVYNTMMMSVLERMREFGVVQALGMRPGRLSQLVFWEAVLKVGVGVVGGYLVMGILAYFFGGMPIPIPPELAEASASYGFPIEEMRFSTAPCVFLEPVIALFFIVLLAIAYPVYRVRNIEVIEALRWV